MRHENASVFHTSMWLDALRRTYQYQPVAFTDSSPGERLNNAILFCRVRSWITGARLVSLPFSDHCEPLVDEPNMLCGLLDSLLTREGREGGYVELRPRKGSGIPKPFNPSASFYLHSIDLRQDLDTLFSRLHRSHTQRAVRKAERVGLDLEVGRSAELLTVFYALHTLTRRRHGMPVQPLNWFQNLFDCLGDRVSVWLARDQQRPVAAIVTAVHKQSLIYKYGCSDTAYNRLGGTSLLFWRAIQWAKKHGLEEFDLGRSNLDDEGLLAFKDHLGAQRAALTYYRCPTSSTNRASVWTPTFVRVARSVVPKTVQIHIGNRLYKHFA